MHAPREFFVDTGKVTTRSRERLGCKHCVEKEPSSSRMESQPDQGYPALEKQGGGEGAPVVVKRGHGLSECLFNRFEDFRLAQI